MDEIKIRYSLDRLYLGLDRTGRYNNIYQITVKNVNVLTSVAHRKKGGRSPPDFYNENSIGVI